MTVNVLDDGVAPETQFTEKTAPGLVTVSDNEAWFPGSVKS